MKLNALSFEIGFNGENYRVILVVWGTINSGKGVDPGELLDEPMQISPKLYCAVPWLKCKPIDCQDIEFSRRTMLHTLYPTYTRT